MVRTDGILPEEPEGVILRRKTSLVQPRLRSMCVGGYSLQLLFLVTMLVVEFSSSTVWHTAEVGDESRDFELTCSSHYEDIFSHFTRLLSSVVSMLVTC